jgi:cell division protein ZapA
MVENNYLTDKLKDLEEENFTLSKYEQDLKMKKDMLQKEVLILRERLNTKEKAKMENDIISKTTIKQEEYLHKEITENNKKIRLIQNKVDDLNFEIKRNEDILSSGSRENNSAQAVNENLDRHLLTMKESIDITKNKIKNIHNEIDIAQDYLNEASTDNKHLMRKLNELALVLTNINDNNTKLTTSLAFITQSTANKVKLMEMDCEQLDTITNQKNKIIQLLKDINSYSNILNSS